MSWWGKVIGGTFGFMLGGPLGAVLGGALGHNFDRGMDKVKLGVGAPDVEQIQSAFFTAVFSIMGHVAKADGKVSPTEIRVTEQVMEQMQLSGEQRRVAIKLFHQGKRDDFPLDDILSQFRKVCHRRRNLMQMFLEIQIATALADGELDEAENLILNHVAEALGFSDYEYRSIFSRVQAQSHFQQDQVAGDGQALKDAYQLLGINEDASDDEVKRAYRRQMNQHHPDKLVAKGLPQEMIDIANRKSQDIRNAYELIKQSRKSSA